MKKIYTMAGAMLFLAAAAFAQAPAKDLPLATPKLLANDGDYYVINGGKENPQNQIQAYGDIFWSEDFTGGFPGSWSMVDNTGNGFDWTWENQTTNFIATYTDVSPINSTTGGAGGYMMLFGDGYNPNQPFVDMDAYFQTDIIVCTGRPSVICKFEEKFRYCCSGVNSFLSLWVSNDNVTWTEYMAFNIERGLSGRVNVNTGSPDPAVVYINISAVAANQPQVWLRFHKYGASHYYWMLDDIELIEGPADDIIVTEELVDFIYTDADGFYTQTPTTQVADLEFRSVIFNNGYNALTNANMQVEIFDATQTLVWNQTTTNAASIATLTWDTVFGETVVPLQWTGIPQTVESYTALYTFVHATVDQDPLTDTVTTKWEVSDSVYARDYGTPYSVIGPHNYVDGGLDGDRMGTYYEIVSDVEVTSISFYVGNGTSTTMSVFAQIWPLDAQCNVDINPVVQSALIPITANDIDTWMTVSIPQTMLTSASPCGGTYAVLLEMYGYDIPQNNDEFNFGEDDLVNQAPGWNIMWLTFNSQWWGFTAGVPMIRLNTVSPLCGSFNVTLGTVVDESTPGAADGSATVNPTGGTSPYTYLWNPGGQTTNPATGLNAGTYTCTITDDNGCTEVVTADIITTACVGFSVTTGAIVDESSPGANDGSATANVTGGTSPYTYFWNPGGATTNPATGLSAGVYTCTVTDDNGCTEVITAQINVVGIDELSLNASVSIFPNPSNGVFTVEFTKAAGDDYQLEISNILGQEVYSENLAISGSFTKQLDLKSLEKGVYFLKVSNSAGAATYKLVIE